MNEIEEQNREADNAGPETPEGPDGAGAGAGEASSAGEPDSQHLRLLEAIIFASPEPLHEKTMADRMPDGADIQGLLAALKDHYENHGFNLAEAGGRWFFRTATDLADQLRVYKSVSRRLSRAAMETLAIIAYHQPVTRAEIEETRGVSLSRGTLDALLEAGWIGPKGKRRTAGRPTTWGTSPTFLVEFGIESIADLPGLEDLKAAGLLDKRPSMQITDMQPTAFNEGDDIDSEPEDENDEADELIALEDDLVNSPEEDTPQDEDTPENNPDTINPPD